MGELTNVVTLVKGPAYPNKPATGEVSVSTERQPSFSLWRLAIKDPALMNTFEAKTAAYIVEGINRVKTWGAFCESIQVLPEEKPDDITQRAERLIAEVDTVHASLELITLLPQIVQLQNFFTDEEQFQREVTRLTNIESGSSSSFQQKIAGLSHEEIQLALLALYGDKLREKFEKIPGITPATDSFIDVPIENNLQLKEFLSTGLSRISHDAKGPLTAIKAWLQLLQRKPENYSNYRLPVIASYPQINVKVDEQLKEILTQRKQVSVTEIQAYIDGDIVPFLTKQGFDPKSETIVEISPESKTAVAAIAPHVLKDLILQIAHNTVKQYTAKESEQLPRNFTIRVEKGDGTLDIYCEDLAGGFKEEFLAAGGYRKAQQEGIHGYEGAHAVSSQGQGIATYEELLESFGAECVPSNYEKEIDGRIYIGARTLIRIPLVTQQ